MSADQRPEQTIIRTDLGAIFVSLELSRATWLIMSLSPGRQKMATDQVRGGDTGLEQRTDRGADQSTQDAQAADVRPCRPGPDRAPVPTRRMITKSRQEPV